MHLSPRETNDLARFFARRFPTREEADSMARRAGVQLEDTLAGDNVIVWSTLLVEAQVQKRLRRLAKAVSRADAEDDSLQEVCKLLAKGEGPSPVVVGIGVAAGVLAVCAFAFGAWMGLNGGSADDVAVAGVSLVEDPLVAVEQLDLGPTEAEALEAVALEAELVDAEPVEAEPVEAEPVEAEPVEAEPVEAEPVEAIAEATPVPVDDAASAEPEPVTTQVKTASIAPAARPTGCRGADGEVVGYFYGGTEPMGSAGQTITLPMSVNVRADYPDKHNGYNARSALRCTLKKGTTVTLAKAPMAVPGDAYWVPLVAGSYTR